MEEYAAFGDELRSQYADLDPPTLFVTDTIDFLHGQAPLHARPMLLRIFKLR